MRLETTYEMRSIDPVVEGNAIRQRLDNYAVVHIRPGWHIENLRGFYDGLTEQIGTCIKIGEDFASGGVQTGEKWLEIRYDADIPDEVAYRHSRNAQPLHTDESYINAPADLMLFYCVNRAPSGGATVFIHGGDLLEYLRRNEPRMLKELLDTPITWSKGGESRRQRIISCDDDGRVRLNYNYYCIDPNETSGAKELNQRFFEILQASVVGSRMCHEVLLAPGEAVVWWDEYVLHGRTSFEANKTNDRFIWKAGIRAA